MELKKFLSLPSVNKKKNHSNMLIIPVKEGESIEKALKKYKKKYEKVGIVKQLRERQSFTKPSINRRQEIIRAKYRLYMQLTEQ